MSAPPPLPWGVASRTLRGETDSGDRHLVKVGPEGALFAVADGLGHGPAAARAAERAVQAVDRDSALPLEELIERCHRALVDSRGVAMSVARWVERDRTVSWIGVGNVDGLVLPNGSVSPPPIGRLVQRGGVLGVRVPALHVSTVPIRGASLLILTTDGIAQGFDRGLDTRGDPETLAQRILEFHARGTDDALVLVAHLHA